MIFYPHLLQPIAGLHFHCDTLIGASRKRVFGQRQSGSIGWKKFEQQKHHEPAGSGHGELLTVQRRDPGGRGRPEGVLARPQDHQRRHRGHHRRHVRLPLGFGQDTTAKSASEYACHFNFLEF